MLVRISQRNLAIISAVVLLLLPSFAFAIDVPGWPLVPCGISQDNPATPDINEAKTCGRCDLFKLLKNLIDFTVGGLMPTLAILLFVWAGFLILLGGANPSWYAQGRTIFTNTFFGIIILLSAWLITNTLILSVGAKYNNAANWWQFTCVEPAPVSPPVIALTVTTSSLPNGYKGKNYFQTLSAGGGTSPFTWSISVGSLPPGLALSGSTISGIPTTTGTFSFTAKASDSSRPVKTATKGLSITVNVEGALAINTSNLPNGAVGQAYSQQVAASGGITPYSWSVQGSLPPGLNISQSSGIISGTPTTAGSYDFTAVVTDSSNPQLTATRPLSIVIGEVVGDACDNSQVLAQQHSTVYPRKRAQELEQLLSCMAGKLEQTMPSEGGSNHFYGSLYTYDQSSVLCNYTRADKHCDASCSHAANSCHYGGKTGTEGSLAVDFGNEEKGDTIIQAALACEAKSGRCENAAGVAVSCASSSATHVHISSKSCDAN